MLNEPSTQASDEIKVRRASEPEGSIVSAARAWALAFEARQCDAATPSGGDSELALHHALANATELKRAELALYQAILASDLTAK
ncbi:MAG: hypothetical protein ACREFI_04605 [Stellaceae bacterium]